MIEIRKLKDVDPAALSQFCSECIAEQEVHQLGFFIKISKVVEAIDEYSSDPRKICLAAIDDEKMVGAALGTIGYYPFSDFKICSQKFLRVNPNYRGQGIGKMLIDRISSWGSSNGCKMILAGVHEMASSEIEKTNSAFMDMGFKVLSREYYKEI